MAKNYEDDENFGIDAPELAEIEDSPDYGNIANSALDIASLFPGVRNLISGGGNRRAQSAYQNAIDSLTANMPRELASLIPQLALQQAQGLLTPAQMQAAIQKQSEALGIKTDPKLLEAQYQSLNDLQKIVKEGGLTAIDRAKLNEINNKVNADNRGRQLAVQQQAQEQGIGGSGFDLASRLSSAQQANNAASDQAVDVASLAQQRALQAIAGSGQLAGQIQDRVFNEDLNKAKSQDAVNAFNANLAQQANMANTTNDQRARELNYNTQNEINKNNTLIKNQNALLPLQTRQTENDQRLRYGNQLANAYQTQGQQLQTQADKTGAKNQSTLSGIINNSGKYIKAGKDLFAAFSDKNLKKDIKQLTDDEVDAMMDDWTGYKFSYKEKVGNPGEKIGVMAQEIEKSPLKNQVLNTEKGKVIIDDDSEVGMKMAALNNLAKRIQKLEKK